MVLNTLIYIALVIIVIIVIIYLLRVLFGVLFIGAALDGNMLHIGALGITFPIQGIKI
jgi:hypothetical protein